MFDCGLDVGFDDLEPQILARELAIAQLRLQQAEALRALDTVQVQRIDGSRSLQE